MDDKQIKKNVAKKIHSIADKADWSHLSIPERQKYYEEWTDDPEIGGTLAQIMEPRRIRVYLKDTIMKDYAKSKRPELKKLLGSLSYSYIIASKNYIKPVGLLCDGNKLYTISVAKEWKISLLSAFERGYEVKNIKENVLFIIDHTSGRFVDNSYRKLIEDSSSRLGVKIIWVT